MDHENHAVNTLPAYHSRCVRAGGTKNKVGHGPETLLPGLRVYIYIIAPEASVRDDLSGRNPG
jgi:hypothetical protein